MLETRHIFPVHIRFLGDNGTAELTPHLRFLSIAVGALEQVVVIAARVTRTVHLIADSVCIIGKLTGGFFFCPTAADDSPAAPSVRVFELITDLRYSARFIYSAIFF